jgi:phenylalanyl-tRNA synthetase beta chain
VAVDLDREADVVEEIGRHLGYDRIPSRAPAQAPRTSVSRGSELEDRVRDRLASLGFCEAFNYAMIGPGEDTPFVEDGAPPPLALTNPIAETLAMLRRSIVPGLLRSADQNLRRGTTDVRLFEVGRVFHPRSEGQLPDEPLRAGFAWSGAAAPTGANPRPVDLFGAGLAERFYDDRSGNAVEVARRFPGCTRAF